MLKKINKNELASYFNKESEYMLSTKEKSKYVNLSDPYVKDPKKMINKQYGNIGFCIFESGFKTNYCDPSICSDRNCAQKQELKL